MKGSEKQVAWAEKIRQELLDHVESEAAKFESRGKTDEMKARGVGIAKAYRGALKNYLNRKDETQAARREDAKWWIDNRDNHFNTVHKWAMDRFDKEFPKPTGETNRNYVPRD